jgi:hypothetical protein
MSTIYNQQEYAIPNKLNGPTILNADQARGRVLFVDRGVVPLINKVLTAQAAGAIGVVIADDGNQCHVLVYQRNYSITIYASFIMF